MPEAPQIPLIDISPLTPEGRQAVAAQIGEACRRHGFFYIVGHGVPPSLFEELSRLSRAFFALPLAQKMKIEMAKGGRAWRGYFPLGGELTSGQPDLKEGLYFGSELGPEHPLVKAGRPLHGPNLFPDLPGFRQVVLRYIEALSEVGHQLMELLALSLGLEADYFDRHYTRDPLLLFRIFHYPPDDRSANAQPQWGVGEHTDYGLLTILKQDEVGGLEINSLGQWIPAPVIEGSLICNIGDMLDRMTAGLYRSTPHRVRNLSGRQRLSFPFFFDPNFDAAVQPIDTSRTPTEVARWDQANVHSFTGTYGDYLMAKIGRVFPDLGQTVLPTSED